jgi:hypothetical protein
MDWSKDEATVAQEHPERGKFLAALAGVIEPAAALRLWDLTIKGVRLQPTLSDKDWKNNPHYRELSTGFAQQLQMREGGRFALWTGGYDVSMYAQGHGYFTLEMTRAGKIYDQLKLFKQFSALGEMWNNISRQFVQSAFGEVHVFLRTFDPSSVMMTEELPEAVMLEGVTTVKWHLLKGDKLADLTEVDPADQPVASYAFDSYRDVATLMQTRRFNDKNKAWVEKRSLLPSEKQAMKEQVLLEGALVVPDQFRAVEDDVRARSNMYDLDESDPAVAAELEQIRQRGLLAIRSGTRIDHVREFVAEAVQRTRRKVLSVGEMRELQRHAETLAMSMRVHNDKRVAEIVEEAKDVGLKAQQAGRIGDALAAGRSHIDEALTKVAV